MAFMTNSVIDFDQIEQGGYSVEDYTSFNFRKVEEYLSECPEDYFDWYQATDDDKIEKISYDVYNTTKYWDILILINSRNPLFDMSYRYDVLENIVTEKIAKYESEVRQLNDSRRTALFRKYLDELIVKNEVLRQVRIVKPEKIIEFLKLGYEKGCFR